MNLATIEANKALALDAFARGDLEGADALYAELEPEYTRHGLSDGLVALRFNRLLVALEVGDRRKVSRLMSELGAELHEAQQVTPTLIEVATRVCRLFADPFPGIDHAASAGLVALAADLARPSAPPASREAAPDELPDLDAVARLEPLDAALVITGIADALRGRAGRPSWVAAVQRALGDPAPHDAEGQAALEAFAEAARAQDDFHAYQALVIAYERAAVTAPALAVELSIGLRALEQRGLPDRLRYTAAPPEERRLMVTAQLHGQLAWALASEAGAERAAAGQWRLVREAADRWLSLARARRTRGGGRGRDIAREAQVSLWRARAARAVGDLAGAAAALDGSLRRAQRHAFDDPFVTARVLLEAAVVAERRDAGRADALFGETVDVALPGLDAALRLGQRASLVDEACREGGAPRVATAVEALAGRARCGDDAAAAEHLAVARLLLALAEPHIAPAAAARTTLVLELTAARRGERDAALRALEAARALEDGAAVALATLYLGLADHDAAASPGERAAALERLCEAAVEARALGAGAVRRGVETTVALAHLESGGAADPERAEIHLRRAAEAAEGPALADGAGAWDVMLPPRARWDLERAIERLCEGGNAALARRLCAAERRRAQRRPVATATARYAAEMAAAHRHRFDARFVQRVEVEDCFDLWAPLHRAQGADGWPLRAPRPGEARLEFRVFETWTVGFVVLPDGVRMHRWTLGRTGLGRHVAELRACLRAGDQPQRLRRATGALYDLLWAPFVDALAGVGRVVIAPDGPLCGVPFALLGRDTFVAETVDLVVARPAPPPAFLADDPVAPPTALLVGEATVRDLEISTLCGEHGWFESVSTRMGDELEEDGLVPALAHARIVQLVGELAPGPALTLCEERPPVPVERVAEALAAGGAVCAVLSGPVEGSRGRAAVGGLLAGVRGGVLARHAAPDDDGGVLLRFLASAASAEGSWALVEALGEARRAAIEAGLAPAQWGAYELFIAEGE